MHPIHKHMNGGMSRASSAEKYDAKEAYNKDLTSKARMHYLENDIADKKGMSRQASPLNDFKSGYHKVQHAKGEAHKSPANNITYGDKSGPTGYIGEERKDLMKYNPVDDRAGMSRQKYGGNKGDESRSRRDYSTNPDKNPMAGKSSMKDKMDNFGKGNKKPATEKTYGGNKGDESRSKRDY